MTTTDDERRLERLETQCAFQEELLASLDATVAGQSARLAALERELTSVRASLASLRDTGDGNPGDEPPPPHY